MQTECFRVTGADWPKVPVSKLAEVNPRYAAVNGRYYPFIEMASVGEDFAGILRVDRRKLEGSGLARFKAGDTLFAKITPCPENGKVAFVSKLPDTLGLGSTEFIVLSPCSETDSRFLYHLVCSHSVRGRAVARMEGSTGRQRVPEEVFVNRLLVPMPPHTEQAAIARILDAVDTALERTRESAETARTLRRALLQSSFEFRGWAGLWKDTHCGRIPRSWDAVNGRRAFAIITGGCSSVEALKLPQDDAAPDAWFMKVDDFNDPANRRTIIQTQIGFRARENEQFKVLPIGTVVIAKRGAAIMKNRIRTTAVTVSLDPNLMALQAQPGMHPEFLRLQLEWRNLARYVEDSGVPQLNNKDLYPRYFLVAPEHWQLEIINTITAAERAEDTLIAKCAALKQVKKSLMHDLLTGKVRVGEMAEALAP